MSRNVVRVVEAWVRRAENPHGTYLPTDAEQYRRGGRDERADCAVRAESLGVTVRRHDGPTSSVQRFALTYPTGRWLVLVSGHMLAICDGVIHDWSGQSGRRQIQEVWKVV